MKKRVDILVLKLESYLEQIYYSRQDSFLQVNVPRFLLRNKVPYHLGDR